MRKQPKKLTLNRETVRLLEEPVLRPVAGGTGSECYCSYTNCSEVCIFEPVGCSGPC